MAPAAFFEQLVNAAYNPAFNAQHRPAVLLFAYFSLATGSLLVPVPEELLVGMVGFSAFLGGDGHAHSYLLLALALLPCCAAVVCGDALIWFLGRRLGFAARSRFKFLARAASTSRVAAVESMLRRHGAPAILLARLVPGARICTFFVAGASGVTFWRFVLFDFLGSLVSVAFCLALGALAAHPEFGAAWAREAARSAANVILPILIAAAFVVWLMAALCKRAQRLKVAPHTEVLTQD